MTAQGEKRLDFPFIIFQLSFVIGFKTEMKNEKHQMTKWKIFASLAERFRDLPEAVSVFTGNDECLDHFRLFEVAAKLVQLVEPELIATRIGVPPQVAKILHHHKRFVALRAHESLVLGYLTQHGTSRQRAAIQRIHEDISLGRA